MRRKGRVSRNSPRVSNRRHSYGRGGAHIDGEPDDQTGYRVEILRIGIIGIVVVVVSGDKKSSWKRFDDETGER